MTGVNGAGHLPALGAPWVRPAKVEGEGGAREEGEAEGEGEERGRGRGKCDGGGGRGREQGEAVPLIWTRPTQ